MNIKSKLKKIEKEINEGFCSCIGCKEEIENAEPVIINDTEIMFPAQIPIDADKLRIKDFCDQCGKPINKRKVKSNHREFMKLLGFG